MAWSVNAIYILFWCRYRNLNLALSIRPRIWPVFSWKRFSLFLFLFCFINFVCYLRIVYIHIFIDFYNPRINKVTIIIQNKNTVFDPINLFSKHEPSTFLNDLNYYWPFLCKSSCFLWVSSSNFYFLGMTLLIFTNISRIWQIKTLLLKLESLLAGARIPKMAVCGVKVGRIKLIWKHWTKTDHNNFTRSHS